MKALVAGILDDMLVHDRASFAFLPMPGREHRMHPGAELGLIRTGNDHAANVHVDTRDQTSTQTSVFSNGSPQLDEDLSTRWPGLDPRQVKQADDPSNDELFDDGCWD